MHPIDMDEGYERALRDVRSQMTRYNSRPSELMWYEGAWDYMAAKAFVSKPRPVAENGWFWAFLIAVAVLLISVGTLASSPVESEDGEGVTWGQQLLALVAMAWFFGAGSWAMSRDKRLQQEYLRDFDARVGAAAQEVEG